MKRAAVWILTLVSVFSLGGCKSPSMEPTKVEAESAGQSEAGTAKETSAVEAVTEETRTVAQSEEAVSGPAEVIVSNDSVQGAFFAERDGEAFAVELGLLREEENGISDVSQWAEKNQLILQRQNEEGVSFYDDTYSYRISEYGVEILERETLKPLYTVSFKESIGEDYGNWACLDEGILFVGQYYNGYASADTCYIMAVKLDTGDILWRSEDQTFNSRSFIVKGDVILCGYGFTAEPDYLYQLDKRTGEVIAKTPVRTAADCLVEKDGRLYVHTYNTDYVFSLDGE